MTSPEYATLTVYGPLAAKSWPEPTEQVVFPVPLSTVVSDVLHGTTAPPALVMVQVTVPVGVPEPGAAAATTAVKLAASEVTVGLAFAVMVTMEGDSAMLSVRLGEVDAVKPGDPEYDAVTTTGDCSTTTPGMVQVALPPLRATVSALVPPSPQLSAGRCPGPLVGAGSLSVKVTVPVGVPVEGAIALTVAVKVMLCPATGEGGLDVTAVVVDAASTTSSTAADVEPTSFASPP